MNADRLHHPDLEQRPANPSDVTEIIRVLLYTALQTESSLVSIGVVGPAISFSDDGAGWGKKDFKTNYPLYKLRYLLTRLGCMKLQIASSHRDEAWTTGLMSVVDLEEPQFRDIELPVTGTTIVFQVGCSIEDFDKLFQQARGVVPLEVKLNGKTILSSDSRESFWFTLDTAKPSGQLVLDQILENEQLVDRNGLCFPECG